MCRFHLTNYRARKTCAHHVVEQVRVRINGEKGFQTFCVACHAMLAWSVNQEVKEEKRVEGKPSELTSEEKEALK